jgi:aspartokinase
MLTITQAVQEIIKSNFFYHQGLSTGLINVSSFSRSIKNEVEQRTLKTVTTSAIVMSVKRLLKDQPQLTINDKNQNNHHEMIVRSNLFECTVKNSSSLTKAQSKILEKLSSEHSSFLTITTGVFETTFIASDKLQSFIIDSLKNEQKVGQIENLSSITIKLTPETVITPGAYAHILTQLSWEGINITEVVSTYLELTIILKESDVDKAFSILKHA